MAERLGPKRVAARMRAHGHTVELVDPQYVSCSTCCAAVTRAHIFGVGGYDYWEVNSSEYVGATELFECPASDGTLCEAMTSLLLWYGYGLTRVAEQPNTREAIECIMGTHEADAIPARRWTSAATCLMQSMDLLLTSLEHCYPPPLKHLHYSHQLCQPCCVWGPWELHGLARALTELRVPLPELEQMLVVIAGTWEQGDPVRWPTSAKLLIAQNGYVPQLTFPASGWDYDAVAFKTLNR